MEKEQSQLLHSNLLLLVINMVETQFPFRLDPDGQTVTSVVDLVGDKSPSAKKLCDKSCGVVSSEWSSFA